MTRSWISDHSPQGTVAHAVVQAFFEAWLEYRHRVRRPVPRYVERAFRAFLGCGDRAHGVTTLACPAGHFTREVPGRCKGRGFCECCLARRQLKLGRHLLERVIGNVSVQHAVLCFPPQLRCTLGYDPDLVTGGFAALANAMFEYQRRVAVELFGVPQDRVHPGCVAVNHRVSANLGANHHFHGIFPDGVFVEVEPGARLEFRRLPAPSEEDVAGVAHRACLIFCEVLKARGFWEPGSMSVDVVEGTLKLPGRDASPVRFFGQAARDSEGGVAPLDGAYAFHLFLGNAIELEERPQLEHLVNYILAPPFKDDQLEWDGEGRIVLRLKRERHDGTVCVEFTPFEFLDRLADLVPRPNANALRYYGIYAPRARLRSLAVAVHVVDAKAVTRCPICFRRLRVVRGPKAHGRTTGWTPPDTPSVVNQGGGGRWGEYQRTADQERSLGSRNLMRPI